MELAARWQLLLSYGNPQERMTLDGNSLLAGFAVSTVGFGFFMYGKKQGRPAQILFGLICRFRAPYFVGALLILGALVLEHWLARRRSLNWINTAFFRLNAMISMVFLATTIASVVFTPFQWNFVK